MPFDHQRNLVFLRIPKNRRHLNRADARPSRNSTVHRGAQSLGQAAFLLSQPRQAGLPEAELQALEQQVRWLYTADENDFGYIS